MAMDRKPNCPKEHLTYTVPSKEKNIDSFFKSTIAKEWTLSNYFTKNLNNKYETRKVHNQLLNQFKTELEKVFKCQSVPLPIRTYANQLMQVKYQFNNNSKASTATTTTTFHNNGIIFGDNTTLNDSTITGQSHKKIKIFKQGSCSTNAIKNKEKEEQSTSSVLSDETEESEAENLDDNYISYSTNSSDDSYIVAENIQAAVDNMPRRKLYYLSTQEISQYTNMQKHHMDNDIVFEDRLELSSIFPKREKPSTMPPLTEFSQNFQTLIKEFNRSVGFGSPMNWTLFPTLSTYEQGLACMLWFTSNRIKKKANILPCALSKKFNPVKNNEFDFIIKQVTLLFEAIISDSELNLDWDVTPNCYVNCELNVHFPRHDFILYDKNGTEIGTGEVKPYRTSEALVEIDRCRIAESCKKQLHQRLLTARSNKELYTYGVMINGNQIQLSALNLTNTGEYIYYIIYDNTLPTVKETHAFMEETLVTMVQFLKFMEESLVNQEEVRGELLLPSYSSYLKPTVYMITDEEPSQTQT